MVPRMNRRHEVLAIPMHLQQALQELGSCYEWPDRS